MITGSHILKSSERITQVSVNQTELNFGNFPKEEKQERSFVLTNTGKGLLVIQDITTSCGCTKVEYSKEPISPGGTLEVKVIYEAEKAEYFRKMITIYCNTKDSPLRLTVKGNVK